MQDIVNRISVNNKLNKSTLTEEQKAVIDIRNKNLLVSASAGSGKTFVVVKRIVTRVVEDYQDIDKMLVVTFTNAAALELKERLISELHDVMKKTTDTKQKSHIRKQLTYINRANICTIHSFCLSVIKANFYKLNIDPNVITIEENKSRIKIVECINDLLDEEYKENTTSFSKILDVFNEDKLIEVIYNLYDFSKNMISPDEWLELCLKEYNINEQEVTDLTDLFFGKECVRIIKEIVQLMMIETDEMIQKINGIDEFEPRRKAFCSIYDNLQEINNCDKYEDVFNKLKLLDALPRFSRINSDNEELKGETSNLKKNISKKIEQISNIAYKNTKEIISDLNNMSKEVAWLVCFIQKLNHKYSEIKRENGWIDFSDYEHLTLQVLADENVRSQYTQKYSEIYIDEYQDTSEIQEKILSLISKGNNVVMVGDVKQSIYSFRNAEPRIFNSKYDSFSENIESENNVKIILSTNFRSRREVIDSINYIFYKVMSMDVGQCAYTNKEFLTYGKGYNTPDNSKNESRENQYITEIDVVDTSVSDSNVEYEVMDSEENPVDAYIDDLGSTQKEATYVAKKIKDLMSSDFQVYDKKNKLTRKCRYSDIVILMRSVSSSAETYEQILKSENIPVFSDVATSFYNGQEVGLILAFLKVLDNYYDDISLVSIMYSIMGGFSLDEITIIKNHSKQDYFYDNLLSFALQDNGKEVEKNSALEKEDHTLVQKVKTFLELLKRFNIYLKTYSISEVISKIYEETGIYLAISLEELGKQKCANLDALIEITKKLEKDEITTLYEYIKYIENMKKKQSKSNDTPKLLGENEDVVRIMTIHKSKGLEYPIVILACANKKYNITDTKEIMILDKNVGMGLDIYDYDMNISYPSVIKQIIKNKIKDDILSEELRLLYTAMTRAKEKLIIVAAMNNFEKYMENIASYKRKLSPIVVKTFTSYISLILSVINRDETDSLFRVEVIKLQENIDNRDKLENNINIKNVNNDVIENRTKNKKDFFLEKYEKKEQYDNNLKTESTSEKTYLFENKYKHLGSQNLKKKYTVSEIKEMESSVQIGSKNNDKAGYNEDANYAKPKSLGNDLLGAQYGTIVHYILEKIDYLTYYNKFSTTSEQEKYIDNLIDSVLKIKNIDNISRNMQIQIKNKINRYLNSEIKEYILNCSSIYKEQPFVLHDNIFNQDLPDKTDIVKIPECEGCAEDKVYIQGIIDLYIEYEDGNSILIDFKTDKLNSEKELIDRYRLQIDLYKRGIVESTKKIRTPKIQSYIYSFELEKLIEVK